MILREKGPWLRASPSLVGESREKIVPAGDVRGNAADEAKIYDNR